MELELIREEMSTEQFNHIMEIGLKQAKENDSFDIDEVFDELKD